MSVSSQGVKPQYVSIAGISGTSTVISGSGAQTITLLSYTLNSNASDVVAKWQDLDGSASTTDRSGELHFLSGSTVHADSQWGLLESTVGGSIRLVVLGTGDINGHAVFSVKGSG